MAELIEPFPGPRPFEREDEKYFFGRKQEASEMVSLILAHTTVVLYAQSGAGKTSLLKTKVLSTLERQQGFDVLPIARVRSQEETSAEPLKVANIYVASALRDLSGNSLTPEECGRLTIGEYLAARPRLPHAGEEFDEDEDEEERALRAQNRPRVIIFDQFEELFTLYPERYADRQNFFEQLRDALAADSLLRVVFSMREDYIAELDPYVHILPDSMRIRFRMEQLRKEAALQAAIGPLQRYNEESGRGLSEGLHYDVGVAEKLVDNLRTIKIHSGQEEIEFKGEFIEPLHLQIVCKALLDKMLDEGHEVITLQDLETFGNVNQALKEYFERTMAKAAHQAQINEGDLRRWFERALITQENTRSTVLRGRAETAGIPNAAIDVLAAERLIRSETRDNREWYELSHDKLIEPIRASNLEWLSKQPAEEQIRLSFIARAEKRLASPQDDTLLLNQAELQVASPWANPANKGYDRTLAALVEASQAALDKEKHEREQARALELTQIAEERAAHAEAILAEQARSSRRLRRLLGALVLIALVAVTAAVYAFQQSAAATKARNEAENLRKEAEKQRNLAEMRRTVAVQAQEEEKKKAAEADESAKKEAEAKQKAESERQRAEQQAAAAKQAEARAAHAAQAEKKEREKAEAASEEAKNQKTLAISSKAAARAELMIAQQPNEIEESVKRALGSLALNRNSIEGEQALRHGLSLLPLPAKKIDFYPEQVAFTPDGDITALDKDEVKLFDKEGHVKYGPIEFDSKNFNGIISGDGKYFAKVGNGEVHITNLTNPDENFKPILYPAADDDELGGPVLSPNGKYLARLISGRLLVWETKKGDSAINVGLEEVNDRLDMDEATQLVTFSRDGNFITVPGTENLSVYRIEDSKLVFKIPISNVAAGVALSPKGTYLAFSDFDDKQRLIMKLFDAKTNQEIARWQPPETPEQVVFSPDDNETYIAIVGGSAATVYETKSGREMTRVDPTAGYLRRQIESVVFSPDGKLLATTGQDRTTRLWSVRAGQEIFRMGHDDDVTAVSFSSDGNYLVTASDDIRLWDIRKGGEGFDQYLDGPVDQTVLSHDGKYLAVVYVKSDRQVDSNLALFFQVNHLRMITILETATGQEVARLPALELDKRNLLRLGFSWDDKRLFIITAKKIQTWEITDGKLIDRDSPTISSAALSDDGHYAVMIVNKTIVRMNLDDSTPQQLPFPQGEIGRVVISNDGKKVLGESKSIDSPTFFIWDAETNQVSTHAIGPGIAANVKLSPDGFYVAYSDGNAGHVYDTRSKTEIFKEMGNRIKTVTFSPDGDHVALSLRTLNQIYVFRLSDSQRLQSFQAEIASSQLAFSRDGRYLAAGGSGLLQVWELLGGNEVTRIAYDGSIRAIAFSPTDKYIITGSSDNGVRLALLQIDDLIDLACKRTGGLNLTEWEEYFKGEDYILVCTKPTKVKPLR